MAAISPSGDRVAIIGLVEDKRHLVIVDKGDEPPTQFGLNDQKVRAIEWAGEDQVLLRISETVGLGIGFTADKTELQAAMLVPVDGSRQWSIFQNATTVTGGIRGHYGTVRRDGGWYGYFGGMTMERHGDGNHYFRDGRAELYEVDFGSRKIRRVAKRPDTGRIGRRWLVDGTGAVAAIFDFDNQDGRWTLKNGNGLQLATGKSPLGDISLLGFGNDGSTVLYGDTDAEGHNHWYEAPLAGGEAKEILADKSIRAGYFDARDRRLIGYLEDGNDMSATFTSERHQKIVDATRRAFPGLNMRLVDWNDAFDRLIVRTDGPGDPRSWWIVDIKTGKADPLGTAYPMDRDKVGPMRMVRYKAADGLEMEGVLTLPPGRDPKMLPVILLPHGGPASRDYAGFDWWAQALASRGYAVFQPNFRGSTGYGTTFERAGRGEWGRKMQTDISDGLAELARQKIVDPSRACIMGASYGGYAALAGVTLQQGLYRCAVSVAGVGDVRRLMIDDVRESGHNPTMIRILKDQFVSGRDAGEISPVRFAERADAPVMLIHGKDDIVVPYVQSELMLSALKRAGKPVEMVTLAGEDHWLSKSETRLSMLEAAVRFVEEHNPSR